MIRSERVWPRIVAHADMDAFYAAIEQLDDASLRGRPLLVGPPSARGVVLTASYEARPYGVGSAMPMAKARRMCPNAVIIPPRFDRYQEVSATIMRVASSSGGGSGWHQPQPSPPQCGHGGISGQISCAAVASASARV